MFTPFKCNRARSLRHGHTNHSAVMGLTFSLLLMSCSTADHEVRTYRFPSSLCGVDMRPELIEPFLPGGKDLEEHHRRPVAGFDVCELTVDGKYVFAARQEWWEEGTQALRVAHVHPEVNPDRITAVPGYAYSDTGAVGRLDCPQPSEPDGQLFTILKVIGSGIADKPAMKRAIAAYSEEVRRTPQCDGS